MVGAERSLKLAIQIKKWNKKVKKEKEIPRNTQTTKTALRKIYKSLPFPVEMIEYIIVISYAIRY